MIEGVGLLCNLLQSEAIPLLVDLSIDFQEGAKTPRVVVSDELVQQPLDEQLECDSFGHVTQEHQVVTLTHHGDVFLGDQRGLRQVSGERAIYPEQVLAFVPLLLINDLVVELALPVILLYDEFQR